MVYKFKFCPDGSVERLKARLVVRGDNHVEGKDYKANFFPLAELVNVRNFNCTRNTK